MCRISGELYYIDSSKSMGKRELLLIVAFAIAGAVVYQVMAPPAGPGERNFSVGRIIEHVRREIRGNRASAELTTSIAQPVDPAQIELRLSDMRGVELSVTGEARGDIHAEFRVHSNGYDEAEADRLAKESILRFDPAGGSLIAKVKFPAAGTQRAKLLLRIPARMTVRIDPPSGRLTIENVAAVDLGGARGTTLIQRIAGKVTATQNGGELTITDAGSVRLTTRGTDVRLDAIKGETTLNVRAGDLKVGSTAGPIDVESNGTDVVLENLATTRGTVRVNATNGTVSMKGLRTNGRVDARNADVDVVIDQAAPLEIYNDGEPVQITPPPGGYQLDAVAIDGRITIAGETLLIATTDQEQRAAGAVGGGGPTITVRTTRGDITVRARDAAKPER